MVDPIDGTMNFIHRYVREFKQLTVCMYMYCMHICLCFSVFLLDEVNIWMQLTSVLTDCTGTEVGVCTVQFCEFIQYTTHPLHYNILGSMPTDPV